MKPISCLLFAAIFLLGGCATPTASHRATIPDESFTPVISTADDPHVTAANRYAREMGYRIEIRHGVQFYCRITAPPGSRFPEKQCLTLDGIFQAQQIAEQNQAYFRQHQTCQGTGC